MFKKRLLLSLLWSSGLWCAEAGLASGARVNQQGGWGMNLLVDAAILRIAEESAAAAIGESKAICENHSCKWDGCVNLDGARRVFASAKELDEHVNSFHDIDLKCGWEKCGKEFTEKYPLVSHIRRHIKYNLFKCNNLGCNRAFISGKALTVHKRTHVEDLPYECDSCGKIFKHSGRWISHMQRIHNK